MARFGTIGTQYFDDAGDPLSGGTLTFYESGTTAPKDTFADLELTIPNTNPVVLDAAGRQPNIFFNGAAKCVLKDAAGVQIEVRDPVGDAVSRAAFAQWNALIYYQIGDIVEYGGLYYRSRINANINNQPDSSAAEWELFTLVPVDDTGAEVLEAIGSVRLTAANRYYYTTADNTFAAGTITAFGRSLVDDANAAAARTTLGGTTVGQAFFVAPNPSAVRFPRVNADNSVSLLTDSAFLAAIGARDVDVQEFSESGTWSKPAGATVVLVEVWGAGGGGGGGRSSATDGGRGGAGGRYAVRVFLASELPSSVPVAVGVGGAGGAQNTNGSNGGHSSFGSLLSAYGGEGGVFVSTSARVASALSSDFVDSPTEWDRVHAGPGSGADDGGWRSLLGGAGGGCGGRHNEDFTTTAGTDGGSNAQGATRGGGGAGGAGGSNAPDVVGDAGDDGDPFCGGGGGGGRGGDGGNGGVAAGGGGGGATRSGGVPGGTGGKGGDGYARITSW